MYLTLVDKTKETDIDGLNQFFTIEKKDNKSFVKVKDGLKRTDLGEEKFLININVDDECYKIQNEFLVPTDIGGDIHFRDFIEKCSESYVRDVKINTNIGKKCKDCEFNNKKNTKLKSGFNECWIPNTNLSESQLKNENLVTEIWGGGGGSRSLSGELIENGIYLLKDVEEEDVAQNLHLRNI